MLDADTGAMGMIVLNSKVAVRQFAEEDMELLTSLASVAALKHRNIALTEEAVRRRQLQAMLDQARQIQMRLIPDELPDFPGYEILGRNVPHSGGSSSAPHPRRIETKRSASCCTRARPRSAVWPAAPKRCTP